MSKTNLPVVSLPAPGGANLKIIITGRIRPGKSKLIRDLLNINPTYPNKSRQLEFNCLFAERIFDNDRLCGLRISDNSGRAEAFTHVNFPKSNSIGYFGIDLNALKCFGCEIVRRYTKEDKPVVDELGIIEQSVSEFCRLVKQLTESNHKVVLLVRERGVDFWLGLLS